MLVDVEQDLAQFVSSSAALKQNEQRCSGSFSFKRAQRSAEN
jgi:hypothetical protein